MDKYVYVLSKCNILCEFICAVNPKVVLSWIYEFWCSVLLQVQSIFIEEIAVINNVMIIYFMSITVCIVAHSPP